MSCLPYIFIDQESQDLVRDKASGRGLLWNDTFAEERLLFQPPAVNAMLVLFNRNHNYIAEMLLKINERKEWHDPPPEDSATRAQQDEEIFQTARLIKCVIL
jgi:linoleate 10R-lipoxygenase